MTNESFIVTYWECDGGIWSKDHRAFARLCDAYEFIVNYEILNTPITAVFRFVSIEHIW